MNKEKNNTRRKYNTLIAVLIGNSLLLSADCFAQAGSLDTSFSSDGIVTDGYGGYSYGQAVAIQSDGKIVVAGYANTGSNNDFAAARYNSDGSIDSTFSSDGIVTTAIGTGTDEAHSVAIQSDGKIVLAGGAYNTVTFEYEFGVVRYNSDGSLDNTFSSDGKATTPVTGNDDEGFSVALQSDGKIVVAGRSHNGTSYDFSVARFNINGSIDSTFSSDGKTSLNLHAFGNYDDQCFSVAIQSDGKIVLGGWSYSYSGFSVNEFAAVRYKSDGSLDSTFDSDGIVATLLVVGNCNGNSVAIQSDGKIVLAGTANNDFAAVRYNTDGSLDNTFDSDGIVTTSVGSSGETGTSVAIQSNGKIVVAGYYYINNFPIQTDNDFAMVRYDSTGTLDNSFDSDGIVTTDFGGGSNDYANAVALQSDGKIVVAGSSGSGLYAIARYIGDVVESCSDTLTWTGAVSIYWDNAGNWDKGYVPALCNPVIIPNTTNQPVIFNYGANCKNIEIKSSYGAYLTISGTGVLTVND